MTNYWRQYARCLGADPEIFYPPTESDDGSLEAKAVCAVCPVREPCLEHAITHREKQGVWGGLDERERRRLVRQRRKTARRRVPRVRDAVSCGARACRRRYYPADG